MCGAEREENSASGVPRGQRAGARADTDLSQPVAVRQEADAQRSKGPGDHDGPVKCLVLDRGRTYVASSGSTANAANMVTTPSSTITGSGSLGVWVPRPDRTRAECLMSSQARPG